MPGAFIQNDLATILDSDVFGESTATFKGSSVPGIFDDEDVESQMGEGPTEIIAQPTFTGRETDFSGIADGDPMVIQGESFKVKNWKRDGTGVIEVFLERQ